MIKDLKQAVLNGDSSAQTLFFLKTRHKVFVVLSCVVLNQKEMSAL